MCSAMYSHQSVLGRARSGVLDEVAAHQPDLVAQPARDQLARAARGRALRTAASVDVRRAFGSFPTVTQRTLVEPVVCDEVSRTSANLVMKRGGSSFAFATLW